MARADDAKTKLRKLRDQLAWETSRARARGNTPVTLLQRLEAAAELLSGVCLLGGGSGARRTDTLDEVYEDAIVEGHLALHDWERWVGADDPQKRKARPATGQPRQHERVETSVSVSLLRHGVRTVGSGAVVGTDAVQLTGRNVSLGGMLVIAGKADLPGAVVGSVVHVALDGSQGRPAPARAIVTRRDDSGIALRWVQETEADRRVVEALVAAIQQPKR